MNQMIGAMVNDEGLGFTLKQPPKWQSILTAATAAIPVAVGTYQATRTQPLIPEPEPLWQRRSEPAIEAEDQDRLQRRSSRTGINTNVGFDLNSGLNIGGTTIPILYLALGAGALYLLYREPPKRGR